MDADLMPALRALAERWDTEATPITDAEARARAADQAPVATIDDDRSGNREIEVADATRRAARRPWALATAAAAVAALVAGGVVMGQRRANEVGPATPAASVPEPDTTEPGPSAVPTSTTSASEASDAADRERARELEEDASQRAQDAAFAAMDDARRDALASYDTVAFTATVTEQYDGQADMTSSRSHRVVMRSDGSLYGVGDSFGVNSYDAATGIARNWTRGVDGTVAYQEVVGWADNSTPLMVMLGGLDPTAPISAFADTTIEDAVVDGRDAWIVTNRLTTGLALDDPTGDDQLERWTVDRASGLVVEYAVEWSYDAAGQRATRVVMLTDLGPGAPMPSEFPYEFPVGVEVQRSGDPGGFRPLPPDQAGAAFGAGFVVPADLPDDVVAHVVSQVTTHTRLDAATTASDEVTVEVQIVRATITTRRGFTRTRIDLHALRPLPGAGVPEGWTDGGDALCPGPCGDGITPDAGGAVLTGGAWVGTPYTLEFGALTASRRGVTLSISGGSAAELVALATSLVDPSADG